MTDNDIMPFGKYKGEKMIDVPDNYLKWFWRENEYAWLNGTGDLSRWGRSVMQYISDSFNKDEL